MIARAEKFSLDTKAHVGKCQADIHLLLEAAKATMDLLNGVIKEVGMDNDTGHSDRLDALEDRMESLEDKLGFDFIPEGTEPERPLHRKKGKK